MARQFQRDAQHVERVHGHPAGAVGLLQAAAVGQGLAAVEDADVVQPQEATLEDVGAFHVLAVHPPGEVEQQLVEDALQEGKVGAAAALLFDLIDAQRRPGVHGRVDVVERPLVGRQLSVGMHVPLAQEQHQLLLGEVGVDERQRDAVEGQVPGGVPGILPLVGHGDDVGVVELDPLVVAALLAFRRRRGIGGVALQPVLDHVVIVLFRPEHAGEALAHDRARVGGEVRGDDGGIEVVGLAHPLREDLVEAGTEGSLAGGGQVAVAEAQAHAGALARTQAQGVVGSGLGAGLGRVHALAAGVHHAFVDAVLDVWVLIPSAVEALEVGLVFGEQQRGRAFTVEPAPPVELLLQFERGALRRRRRLHLRAGRVVAPRPAIAEPQRGQQMQGRAVGTAVHRRDAHQQLFHRGLGVLHEDVEVAVLSEDPGVEQFELGVVAGAPLVLLQQAGIGELRLRILVEHLHVGVRGRVVQVEVVLLDVLAVVALVGAEAEETLLENGIALVPQRQGQADLLVAVADAGQAVLVPAIDAGAGVLEGKVLPGFAVAAVVLAHGAPGALGEVRPPALPVDLALARFLQPDLFRGHRVEARQCTPLAMDFAKPARVAESLTQGGPARGAGRRV